MLPKFSMGFTLCTFVSFVVYGFSCGKIDICGVGFFWEC
jgi:hypothetical protein